MSGTAILPAAVGVGALLSATKSDIGRSISWPTALMTGTSEAKIARATISSLKAIRSSKLPPPLPTIKVSNSYFCAFSMFSTISFGACSP